MCGVEQVLLALIACVCLERVRECLRGTLVGAFDDLESDDLRVPRIPLIMSSPH